MTAGPAGKDGSFTKGVGNDFRKALIETLPHLRAVARNLTGNRERADDLVHDTIARALASEAQFQPGTNLKAWLMTILRNHFINGVRRRRLEGDPVDELPESALPTPAPQEHAVEFDEVRRALLSMSVEHREVLVLVSAAGLSYDEAAEVCGCAVGTVKSRLSRARAELRKLMGEDDEAELDALRARNKIGASTL